MKKPLKVSFGNYVRRTWGYGVPVSHMRRLRTDWNASARLSGLMDTYKMFHPSLQAILRSVTLHLPNIRVVRH